jgi:hypothetical protein
MGGYGSTRWHHHRRARRIEECVQLSIRAMRSALAQGPGTAGTAQWEARGQSQGYGQGQVKWWLADTLGTGPTARYETGETGVRPRPSEAEHCPQAPVVRPPGVDETELPWVVPECPRAARMPLFGARLATSTCHGEGAVRHEPSPDGAAG